MSLEKPYYHIQLKYKNPELNIVVTEHELDLSEEDATSFGKKYADGCVFVKGKLIAFAWIKEVEIRETPKSSQKTSINS